mgnify:FL=1
MKKFQYIVVLLFVIVLGTGCSNDEKQENFLSETENEIENKEDGVIYEVYTGNWSNDGRTHDQILSEGGVELSCTITENNRLTGTLFAQQEMTERFAVVEDISGEIEQNELLFDYADDGWGNSGTLHMQFRNDSIYVEILNYCEADGGSDYGISGYYELIRENEAESREKELENTIDERSQYYRASAYYLEIVDYWENVREARDVSNVNEPLFATNKQYYTKENFENEPKLVIHLAKNEIYARHGYIFKNEDLYNYFMGCVWYNPTCKAEDFDDSVLNEYEKANLEILASMDTY